MPAQCYRVRLKAGIVLRKQRIIQLQNRYIFLGMRRFSIL